MKIVCFGANGATGRLLVKQALAEGHAVTAFTRHPEAFPIRDDRLRLACGDALAAGAEVIDRHAAPLGLVDGCGRIVVPRACCGTMDGPLAGEESLTS